MLRAAFLPWPTAAVIVRAPPIMSPPAKMPGCPVLMCASTSTTSPRPIRTPGQRLQKLHVRVLADREHERVGLELSRNCPVPTVPLPSGSISICSTMISSLPNCFTRRHPFDLHAFGERFRRLLGVRPHVLAVGAVDQHRFLGAEAPRDARRIHRGVAAADDPDDASELGRAALARPAPASRARGSSCRHPSPECRGGSPTCAPIGEEYRIEAPGVLLGEHVVDAIVARRSSRPSRGCARSPASVRRAAAGIAECRNASCRRAPELASRISTSWPIRRR